MIEIIKNQPVSFHVGDYDFNTKNKRCTQDNIEFCQSVKPGDKTMFQMLSSPKTGQNIVTNGNFSNGLSGWTTIPPGGWGTIYTGAAFANVNLAVIFQYVPIEANKIYRIKWDVTLIGISSYFSLTTPPEVWGDTTSPVGETGTFTTWISTGNTTNTSGFLIFQLIGSAGAIDNIEMLEMSQPVIYIADANGNNVLNVTDIEYFFDHVQATFVWPELSGKHTICVQGMDDLDYNYLSDSLCLGLENGGALLQENGYCIKWFG